MSKNVTSKSPHLDSRDRNLVHQEFKKQAEKSKNRN